MTHLATDEVGREDEDHVTTALDAVRHVVHDVSTQTEISFMQTQCVLILFIFQRLHQHIVDPIVRPRRAAIAFNFLSSRRTGSSGLAQGRSALPSGAYAVKQMSRSLQKAINFFWVGDTDRAHESSLYEFLHFSPRVHVINVTPRSFTGLVKWMRMASASDTNQGNPIQDSSGLSCMQDEDHVTTALDAVRHVVHDVSTQTEISFMQTQCVLILVIFQRLHQHIVHPSTDEDHVTTALDAVRHVVHDVSPQTEVSFMQTQCVLILVIFQRLHQHIVDPMIHMMEEAIKDEYFLVLLKKINLHRHRVYTRMTRPWSQRIDKY
ncbi:UNVERIFIED_CONTAM: hypothetical protein B566_EDAN018007 [Ephemera danica]|nr:hypothetical protein B566_EDAN018007 [Ephemera danica]